MIASALIAVTLGAPMQMVQCVDVPPGASAASIEARGEPWFLRGAPILLGKRRYVRTGAVRGLAPNEVRAFGRHGEATVFVGASDAGHETVYVLADIRDCSFQAYRAQ